MRTNAVKEIETRQLESLAERYRQDLKNLRALVPPASGALENEAPTDPNPFVRRLLTLPIVTIRPPDGIWSDAARDRRIRIVRDVEVDLSLDPARYRLREERFELDPENHLRSVFGPELVLESEYPGEILDAGYEDIAEDELLEKLWPIIDAVESRVNAEPIPEEIAAVEKILGLPSLTEEERLRVRQDIAGLLEGRVEPGEFISRAVQNDLPAPALYEGTRESLRLTQSIVES